MELKWINRFLLMPATAWFLVMLVLPLLVVLVFSFGERGAAGGYVPAFTFDQYLNLPARLTAFKLLLVTTYLQMPALRWASSVPQVRAIQSSAELRTRAREVSVSATISASWYCRPGMWLSGRSSVGGVRSRM